MAGLGFRGVGFKGVRVLGVQGLGFTGFRVQDLSVWPIGFRAWALSFHESLGFRT